MSRAEFYRNESDRCHAFALTMRDPEDARRWREIAQGYKDVAEQFDGMYRSVREPARPQPPTAVLFRNKV